MKKKKKFKNKKLNSIGLNDSEIEDFLNDPDLDKALQHEINEANKSEPKNMNFIDLIDYQDDLNKVKLDYRRASNYEMCVVKTNLKNIFYDYKISDQFTRLGLLNKIVLDVNKIVTHTYNFLKIFILHSYENKKKLPRMNRDFIQVIMRTICILGNKKAEDNFPPQKGKPLKEENKKLQKELIILFEKYYRKTINDINIPVYDRLSYILNYEASDILKNFENNISEHYIDYVNKYVNVSYNLKDTLNKFEELEKTKEEIQLLKKKYRHKLYLIKKTILEQLKDNENKNLLNKEDIKWIKKNRHTILPKKKFSKNSVYYDVKQNPLDYLYNLLNMNKELEKMKSKEKEEKLFNAIPLRTQIVPKQISIDTAGLISVFEKGEDYSNLLKEIDKQKTNIWKKYFKLHKNEFRRKNKIFHMISTDGVSCCIKFLRLNKKGELIKKVKNKKQEDNYIESASIDELKEINNKKIISIDPNYGDIIYCVSEDKNDKETHFRYTQKERNVKTKKDKYNMIRKYISNKERINGKSVIEIETELSDYSSKTNYLKNFIDYLKVKNRINNQLINHYGKYIFRKLKLNSYINTQKSESKLIKDFKKKYGKSTDCTVIIGDFEKDKNMRGKEPTINKKIRKIFRLNGYKTYLINEFRTSKLCNNCENETKNYLRRYSKKLSKYILVWGLVCCTNSNCELIFNRDVNACKNMLKIVRSIIKTGKRPVSYRRK